MDEKIDLLIKDEQEAIEGYQKAMEGATEAEKAVFSHIIEEELEHIEELKNLKTAMDEPEDEVDLEDPFDLPEEEI